MSAAPASPSPRPPQDDGRPDAPPPLLGTWRNVYLAVLLSQAVLIALLWALTEAFS
jgi:hypothetical protein